MLHDAEARRAEERATALLKSFLSLEQAIAWDDRLYFTEHRHGSEWLFYRSGSLQERTAEVSKIYCVYPDLELSHLEVARVDAAWGYFAERAVILPAPRADIVLAQLLWMRADPEGLRQQSNLIEVWPR